jgi:bile acid:Na+ symporter, BASS family
MNSPLTTVLLPLALAIVMFGLGLSLTWADFVRIRQEPRPVLIALACQLLVLPALCFGLVLAFGLAPALAVGMMLLAASPGGTTANLYSHLFRGDVALNVTLTAVNSVIAVVSLPVVTNFALAHFEPSDAGRVGLQFGKVAQVFAIVLVPVALGMAVHRASPAFSRRMDRPVRALSALVLLAVIVGTVLAERARLGEYLGAVGPIALLFCAASLAVGYGVPRALGVTERQATASGFEIGIHNGTLAIAIAVSVLQRVELAVPAAVYSLVMFPLAALFGWALGRLPARAPKVHAGRVS